MAVSLNPNALAFVPKSKATAPATAPVQKLHHRHQLLPSVYAPDGRRRVDANAPMLTETERSVLHPGAGDLYVYKDREYQKRLEEKLFYEFVEHGRRQAQKERERAEIAAQLAKEEQVIY